MHLTDRELAIVIALRMRKNASVTFLTGVKKLRFISPRLYLLLIATAAFILIATSKLSPWCGWFGLGFIAGISYAIATRLWFGAKDWRVQSEITDWKRVEELIREHRDRIRNPAEELSL